MMSSILSINVCNVSFLFVQYSFLVVGLDNFIVQF